MTATDRTLSPSQVNAFLECPAAWYFGNVLRLPEPTTEGLAIGRAVHTAAALLLTARRDGRQLAGEEIDDAINIACNLHIPTIAMADPQTEEEDAEQIADRHGAEDQARALSLLWWTAAAPSIQPAEIEMSITGQIAGIPINAVIDIVDESRMIVDIKTASKRPNGISPAHRLQVTTYAMLYAPCDESHAVRLDVLTKTKTPAYVKLQTGLAEADYAYAESIYPLVAEAMDEGLYLPHRGGNLCSRRHCAYWQACEAEYGGTVRP
jgi:CRISPR/Cas system-associated exonuclease Cas4 (RecB family)